MPAKPTKRPAQPLTAQEVEEARNGYFRAWSMVNQLNEEGYNIPGRLAPDVIASLYTFAHDLESFRFPDHAAQFVHGLAVEYYENNQRQAA